LKKSTSVPEEKEEIRRIKKSEIPLVEIRGGKVILSAQDSMKYSLKCPKCSYTKLKVVSNLSEEDMKCPKCKTKMVIIAEKEIGKPPISDPVKISESPKVSEKEKPKPNAVKTPESPKVSEKEKVEIEILPMKFEYENWILTIEKIKQTFVLSTMNLTTGNFAEKKFKTYKELSTILKDELKIPPKIIEKILIKIKRKNPESKEEPIPKKTSKKSSKKTSKASSEKTESPKKEETYSEGDVIHVINERKEDLGLGIILNIDKVKGGGLRLQVNFPKFAKDPEATSNVFTQDGNFEIIEHIPTKNKKESIEKWIAENYSKKTTEPKESPKAGITITLVNDNPKNPNINILTLNEQIDIDADKDKTGKIIYNLDAYDFHTANIIPIEGLTKESDVIKTLKVRFNLVISMEENLRILEYLKTLTNALSK